MTRYRDAVFCAPQARRGCRGQGDRGRGQEGAGELWKAEEEAASGAPERVALLPPGARVGGHREVGRRGRGREAV